MPLCLPKDSSTMPKSTLQDFYVLDGPYDPPWWWLTLSKRAGKMLSPKWCKFMDGAYTGDKPVALRLYRGGKQPAVIGSATRLVLISGGLHLILKGGKAKGLVTHPTVVYDKADESIVDRECVWLRLQVGCGPVDLERGCHLLSVGGVSLDPTQEPYGYFFDPSTWNGMDIFRAPNSDRIIISKRLAKRITPDDLPGSKMEPASSFGKGFCDQVRGDLKKLRKRGGSAQR